MEHRFRAYRRARRALSVSVALLGACATPTAVVEGEPDLRGTITLVPPGSPVRSVLVENLQTPASGYSRIDLFVVPPSGPPAEVLIRRVGGETTRATIADLREGVRVTAWVRRGERQSDPPQWDAVRVAIETPQLR